MVQRDMFYFADIDEKFIDTAKNCDGLEDGILVHCQQCIEKNIKGIILKKYGVVSISNNLVELLEILYLADYSQLKEYKGLCRDLKDFYFSRRYASDDYEFLTKDEYDDYLNKFYRLLNDLKKIRENICE